MSIVHIIAPARMPATELAAAGTLPPVGNAPAVRRASKEAFAAPGGGVSVPRNPAQDLRPLALGSARGPVT